MAPAYCTPMLPIEQRVPPEIWARGFRYLYPSQLSRLSLVNKSFYSVVASLPNWSQMFAIGRGSENMRLRTLRDMPESKSYMLYMCAMSLYVCEHCYHMASAGDTIQKKPKLRQAPMRILHNHNRYAGPEIDLHWTISMCDNCALILHDDYTPRLDSKTRERLMWYRTQP